MPHNNPNLLSTWFLTALLATAIVGTADWGLSIWTASGVGMAGAAAGWVVFVALWVLGGSIWALLSGAALWAATGRASAAPLVARLVDVGRRWWHERYDAASDSGRLATLIASAVAVAVFTAASVGVTAYLIENRNGAWLIAGASLVAQIGIAAALLIGGLALRRILRALLFALRRRQRLRWLNAPMALVVVVVVAVVVTIAVITANIELFRAVEGPAIGLVFAALLLHPVLAYLLDRRLHLPAWLRRMLWAAPVVAVVLIGLFSQQPESRRLIVLDGEAANFGFTAIQRHTGLNQLFDRSDCPPQSLDEECVDPVYFRPTERQEIPDFDRPDFERPPSIIFITWDSLRVDRLGFMGHDRDTTPNLDAFAERSLVFDRAFAADSGTGPSFWSLMAGQTPFQVEIADASRFPPVLADEEAMLGGLLEEAGYRNEAVLCGTMFERPYWSIRDGFESFDNVCGRQKDHLAPVVTDAGIEAIERLTAGDEPFFLWVHYFDPHHPYTHHPDLGYGDDELERYDGELTYTDEHMQRLIEAIDERGADSEHPIFTIFSADHGENFDEHGSAPHARNLYRNVTHVPKIVHGPGIEPRRVDAPVALNDVYPTILDLAGVEIPEATTMVSQVPVYFGAAADEGRMVFQENSYSRPRRHTRAVVYDRYHYIMDLTTNTHEFYDFVDDPMERNNLIGAGLVEERIMHQALVRFLETSTIPEELKD